jgi:DNA-binding SARP family transcriptional activator
MPILRIQLLGDFRLTYGDEPLMAIVQARQQALLAYLVLRRDAPQSRHHLAFLFWPDTGEAQALTNLRNLLHKLRQALPEAESWLHSDAQTVQWRPEGPFTLDVADFVSLAGSPAKADLEQATNLYRGDLLPSCYDDWILAERTRLQQVAYGALERLVGLLEEEHDELSIRAAIGYGRRWRQLDPLNEAAHRTIMRLHAANHDRAGVLRAYHTCVKTLQDELAVEPSQETRELCQRLLSTAAAPPSPVGAVQHRPPLVGRQREWKALQAAWHATSGGGPHCVMLSGEAGVGKTRLAEELLTWASRQGFVVAAARCYAAEGALAYASAIAWLRSPALRPWLAALEPAWASEVARLLPELLAERPDLSPPAPLTEGTQRQRLFEALTRALLRRQEPLLLLMDDLPWCDRDTLEWLHYLLRYDPGARLLVVGTVRVEDFADDHALTALLTALRREGQLTELALDPLSADETASLAAHMVEHALTAEQAARLFRETEGNPLFVVETLRFGWGQDQEEMEDGQASHPSPISNLLPLPPKVHAVLQSRLAQLSPDARELAGLAAAIGREFTFPILAQASGQDEDVLVSSLDELWQRRIVRGAPGRGAEAYDFTHDKLREVAYNSLSAARRRLLHGRIAQALEAGCEQSSDAVCGQVAVHYELAGRFEQAIPYYQRAAEAAQRVYANAEAIRYCRRALALLEGPAGYRSALAPVAIDLYEQLGDILHWTGQYEEARAAFQAALRVPCADPLVQARLQRKTGNTWREQYRYPEALQVYADAERVLSEAAPLDREGSWPTTPAEGELPAARVRRSPPWWQEWIQVLIEINMVHYWLGQVRESDALRHKLRPAVEQHGTPHQRAEFFRHTALIGFRRNRCVATDEIVAWANAALAAQREAGNRAAIPMAQFGVGFFLLWSGNPSGAMEPLQTALHLAEGTGDVSLQARCLTYLTVAYRQRGQREEAWRCAARSLEVAVGAHMPEYVGMAKANQAWVAWCAGDLSQAKELGHAALELWHQLPAGHASAPFQWLALWLLMAVALHEGEFSLATDDARALLDPAQQRLPAALAADLVQAVQAWDEGAFETAHALLHQSLDLAQQLHYL